MWLDASFPQYIRPICGRRMGSLFARTVSRHIRPATDGTLDDYYRDACNGKKLSERDFTSSYTFNFETLCLEANHFDSVLIKGKAIRVMSFSLLD